MPKTVVFLVFVVFLLFGIAVSVWSAIAPVRMAVEGIVWSVEWESRNHGIPLIEIKLKNGVVRQFTSHKISLSQGSIEKGDSFRKLSGSKNCFVTEIEVNCLR